MEREMILNVLEEQAEIAKKIEALEQQIINLKDCLVGVFKGNVYSNVEALREDLKKLT